MEAEIEVIPSNTEDFSYCVNTVTDDEDENNLPLVINSSFSKGLCIFCASECPASFTVINGKVKRINAEGKTEDDEKEGRHPDDTKEVRQLRSMFIVRKILDVRASTCSKFLGEFEGQLDPEYWVNVCSDCDAPVYEYYMGFMEIRKLERRMKGIKGKLKGLIQESSSIYGRVGDEGNVGDNGTGRGAAAVVSYAIWRRIREEAEKSLSEPPEAEEEDNLGYESSVESEPLPNFSVEVELIEEPLIPRVDEEMISFTTPTHSCSEDETVVVMEGLRRGRANKGRKRRQTTKPSQKKRCSTRLNSDKKAANVDNKTDRQPAPAPESQPPKLSSSSWPSRANGKLSVVKRVNELPAVVKKVTKGNILSAKNSCHMPTTPTNLPSSSSSSSTTENDNEREKKQDSKNKSKITYYKCEKCGALLQGSQEKIQSHEKLHKGEKISHKCTTCGWLVGSLKTHANFWHSDRKPNISGGNVVIRPLSTFGKHQDLSVLKETNSSNPNYVVYRQFHTTKYACKRCEGMMFKDKPKMIEHAKLHDEGTGTVCGSCGWLIKPENMKIHIGIRHNMFHKSYIGPPVPHKDNILRETNNGDDNDANSQQLLNLPHKCDECGALFKTGRRLNSHQDAMSHKNNGVTVSGQHPMKSFHCDHCDSSYMTKRGLEYHQRTHLSKKTKERKGGSGESTKNMHDVNANEASEGKHRVPHTRNKRRRRIKGKF